MNNYKSAKSFFIHIKKIKVLIQILNSQTFFKIMKKIA